jgi:Flp pilus assembly protein TadB
MIITLGLLLVLLFVAMGFALHALWVAAAIVFFIWLAAFALRRRETAGTHRF